MSRRKGRGQGRGTRQVPRDQNIMSVIWNVVGPNGPLAQRFRLTCSHYKPFKPPAPFKREREALNILMLIAKSLSQPKPNNDFVEILLDEFTVYNDKPHSVNLCPLSSLIPTSLLSSSLLLFTLAWRASERRWPRPEHDPDPALEACRG